MLLISLNITLYLIILVLNYKYEIINNFRWDQTLDFTQFSFSLTSKMLLVSLVNQIYNYGFRDTSFLIFLFIILLYVVIVIFGDEALMWVLKLKNTK